MLHKIGPETEFLFSVIDMTCRYDLTLKHLLRINKRITLTI